MTVRAGSLGRAWHTTHVTLSVLTCGWWLPIYGAHALVSRLTRPTVQLDVPDGHRIEYRNGWPNVLAPGEYLEPRTGRERVWLAAGYAGPALILAAVVAGLALR